MLGASLQNPGLPLSGGTLTGPLLLPDGSIGSPGLAFANNPDMGIYLSSNRLTFTADTKDVFQLFQSSGKGVLQGVTSGSYSLIAQAATAAIPSLIPNNTDQNTGVGWAGADKMSLIAGGVEALRAEGDGLSIIDGVTAPSAVTGRAKIFVDSADGDLKIIFADGIVKTIVVDI